MGLRFYLASIAAAALLVTPLVASAETTTDHAYYKLAWSSIPIGRIRIDTEESNFSYSMVVDTKSKGMVSAFKPFQTVATVNGYKSDDAYIPRAYKSRSEKNDECENCGTNITYESDGTIKTRAHIPADDPAWRPVVPLEDANTGVDPITGYYKLRQQLRENLANHIRQTTIRLYDGKRLADITVIVTGRDQTMVGDKLVPGIFTVIKRKPIAGYTPKELKKFAKGDPLFYATFSDDKKLQLLHAECAVKVGTITMELSEEP